MSSQKRMVLPNYLTVTKFTKNFSSEKKCEKRLFSLKYPNGYACSSCESTRFYRLNGKRNRVFECRKCGKQESLTANTIFAGTRTPLLKWFWAFYYISQNKKSISSIQLGKNIGVSDMTAWLILMKIRKSMEEDVVSYQIGGAGKIVQVDEIDIGGKGSEKQKVLMLLELDEADKIRRLRFSPLKDKSRTTIESNLLPMVARGTTVKTDGNETYNFLEKNIHFSWDSLPHWKENDEHKHLKEINMIIGNFKNWYRGIFGCYEAKNVSYYLNEFSYRFNRRRSESDIFNRLLKRSITRTKIMTYKELTSPEEYYPMAA